MNGGYLLTNTPTNSLANLVNDILTKNKVTYFYWKKIYMKGIIYGPPQ